MPTYDDWAIWKYKLDLSAETELELPEGVKPLHVGIQVQGPVQVLYLWALVNTDTHAVETWKFKPFMTGESMRTPGAATNMNLIGTVLVVEEGGDTHAVHVSAVRVMQ